MLITFLGLILLATPGPQFALHSVPFVGSNVLALELFVPNAWGVIESPPNLNSLRGIQIAINNRGVDSLWVRAFPEGDEGFRIWIDGGPKGFASVLPPGTVYLEISVLSGGPLPTHTPYAWVPEERVENSVRRTARLRNAAWEDDQGVGYQAHFIHWGYAWTATIYGRRHFSGRDLDRAFAVLESIRLPDIPVMEGCQAVELALRALPDDIRQAALESDRQCGGGPLRIETQTTRTGFRVEFNILGATPRDGKYVKSASFDVTRDGTVTPVGGDSQ
jgi:hypothetical protein